MPKSVAFDVLGLVGLVLLTVGLRQVSPALAAIVVGGLLLGAGVLGSLGASRVRDQDKR